MPIFFLLPCSHRNRCLELWGPFFGTPESFRPHFGWHNSLCIVKAKAFLGTKLDSYFNFPSLYDIWKDQFYRISGSEFYEWLFGAENFGGLSRNGSQKSFQLSLRPLPSDHHYITWRVYSRSFHIPSYALCNCFLSGEGEQLDLELVMTILEPAQIEETILCDLKHSSALVYVYIKATFVVG